MKERKTVGSVCHTTRDANMRDKAREFIQSHAPPASFCAFFSLIVRIFCYIQRAFCACPIPHSYKGLVVCVCLPSCTHKGCGLCMLQGLDNTKKGSLLVSEWSTEENNKAPMTGTDGPLYCPLKCKHWISLLGGWHHYIFIFFLLSLSLLIALLAGTHPHLRLKSWIQRYSQMLVVECLEFNGQWHGTKMTRGGANVQTTSI